MVSVLLRRFKMLDLEKINFEAIIISAVKNPQKQIVNFDELKEKAIKENKGAGEKIIFENEKFKLIFRIM